MGPLLLRVSEAAALLNVSRWTVYRWIEEGRLKATKIGKSSLRVFHDSALALVEENRIEEGNHPIDALQANRHPAPICVSVD
ncbi:helix-turn-helix domain-containing protein [Nitrospira sp. Nam74]